MAKLPQSYVNVLFSNLLALGLTFTNICRRIHNDKIISKLYKFSIVEFLVLNFFPGTEFNPRRNPEELRLQNLIYFN